MTIQRSIVRRYLVLSVLSVALPVLSIGLLYDRFTSNALERVLGEKIQAHLTATANRLSAYLEARRYQIETLANYPGITRLAGTAGSVASRDVSEIAALLQIESDLPDLYGILFLDADGRLLRAVPGQAAAGPPYWGDRPFSTALLPVTALGESEVLGPVGASAGDSGWLLVRAPLHTGQTGHISGYIALHVRLASLTEQLGTVAATGALQPLLRTPVGDFNAVGQQSNAEGRLIVGPELLPGWRPMLEVEPDGLLRAFTLERRALLAAALVGSGLVMLVFYLLSRQLRRRIGLLVRGANALAVGQLDHHIDERGDDEIASVSHAFNDMSRKLRDYLERAVHMERLAVLGEFAGGIAHEIRNPLAALKTTVQALGRREHEPRRVQLLSDMEDEIDRLARVVSDLLDFGRPHPPIPSAVPVRELLRRVALTIEPQAQSRQVHLNYQGDGNLSLWADADHVHQIILNLALNAVQATPAGGAVVLRALPADLDAQVMIEVRDTGCGIPTELLGRVSEPFFTTKTQGIGLGLSISRQLCELNGGQITLDSAPGQGTVVHVCLPAPPALLPAPHAEHLDH